MDLAPIFGRQEVFHQSFRPRLGLCRFILLADHAVVENEDNIQHQEDNNSASDPPLLSAQRTSLFLIRSHLIVGTLELCTSSRTNTKEEKNIYSFIHSGITDHPSCGLLAQLSTVRTPKLSITEWLLSPGTSSSSIVSNLHSLHPSPSNAYLPAMSV